MRKHYLSRDAYYQFIQSELFGKPYEESYKNLAGWVSEAKVYFDIEFTGYNYFLSKNLEIYLKNGSNCLDIISFIYSVQNHMVFSIEEFDHAFIDRMLLNHLPKDLNTLDQDLLDVLDN